MSKLLKCWVDFAQFLKKPELCSPSGLRSAGALQLLVALWVLNILGLVVAVTIVVCWLKWTGLPGPKAFEMLPQNWLFPLAVFVAPVLEEPLFRGWLSGRPRTLWLLGCVASLAFIATLQSVEPLTKALLLLALLLAMPSGWFLLRKRPVARWFIYSFPLLFWLGSAIFGLVHLLNYPQPGPLALPVIMPQIWAGLVLGYIRVRIGLAAAMLIHGGSNALMVISLWL